MVYIYSHGVMSYLNNKKPSQTRSLRGLEKKMHKSPAKGNQY